MFGRIVGFSLNNRLMVLALALALTIGGLLSLSRLPVDVFPDLNRTTVTVMTEAEGLAAEEVETLVTVPVEQALNGMPGVLRLRSSSAPGLSIVYVDFNYGADVYRNRQLVTERLATAAPLLPANAQPHLTPVASIMGEIMLVAVSGPDRDGSLRELTDFTLRPKLLAVPGIAQVVPIGGNVRQYRISPRLDAMARLGVRLEQLEAAARGFARNGGGGFLNASEREVSIRAVGRTTDIAELARLTVAVRDGVPLRLDQVADVGYASAPRRGDGGFGGKPAVIVSVSKQPGADSVAVTREVEAALAQLQRTLPADVRVNQVQFRQADFIERSVGNLQRVLVEALLVVGVVLFAFLRSGRTAGISLLAIPLSVLATAVVFELAGVSINTMTLGGIAIAVGELVDDAVVDVENILRRLRENALLSIPHPVLAVVRDASQEVRSGIVYATAIIVLVFVPLFALTGLEGQLFRPLGVAYVTAILASLLVSITVSPVLASFLLPGLVAKAHAEPRWIGTMKRRYGRLLDSAWRHERALYAVSAALILAAIGGTLTLPRTFLPPFNEGSFTVNLQFQPGISLDESARMGAIGERLAAGVPGVASVSRRTGRGELDEHAEGVHYGEIDVRLDPASGRSKDDVAADLRDRLAIIPAAVNVGQPIGHRLDHLTSGVRAEIALKIFNEDLDQSRAIAGVLETRLQAIPGLADVAVERVTRVPQLDIRVRPEAAAAYGITPAAVTDAVEALSGGRTVATVVQGVRRHDVVIRLVEPLRSLDAMAGVLVDAPAGPVALGLLADIAEVQAPNQLLRENGRRRLAVLANTDGTRPGQEVLAAVEAAVAEVRLPAGASIALEGTFQAQRDATRTLSLLAGAALLLIFAVLYTRYRSVALTFIIMGSVPLALVGAVAALWIAGQPLSVASMVGFITLTGIAARNGILKASHYINLVLHEGERFGPSMIRRGSEERLVPVLMTALSAGLALAPLLIDADAPGKEILHPVAVTIFGGLVTSTLLDSLLTPLLFRRYGRNAVRRLRTSDQTMF